VVAQISAGAVCDAANSSPRAPRATTNTANASRIAEAHRGRATAQNRDDGRGVVVSVTLPYATMS
jgi:hypothetical protein